jgi:hypothetical protein
VEIPEPKRFGRIRGRIEAGCLPPTETQLKMLRDLGYFDAVGAAGTVGRGEEVGMETEGEGSETNMKSSSSPKAPRTIQDASDAIGALKEAANAGMSAVEFRRKKGREAFEGVGGAGFARKAKRAQFESRWQSQETIVAGQLPRYPGPPQATAQATGKAASTGKFGK